MDGTMHLDETAYLVNVGETAIGLIFCGQYSPH